MSNEIFSFGRINLNRQKRARGSLVLKRCLPKGEILFFEILLKLMFDTIVLLLTKIINRLID